MESILVGTVEQDQDRFFAVRLGQQPYRTFVLHLSNFPPINFPIYRGDVLEVKVNANRGVEAILRKRGSFENGRSYFQAEAMHIDNVITTRSESIKITDPDGIHTNQLGIFTVGFKDRIDKQNDHLTTFYAVEVDAQGEILRKKQPVVQIPMTVSNNFQSTLALVTTAGKGMAFMVTLDKKPYRTIVAFFSKIHTPFNLAPGQIIDIDFTDEGHVTAVKSLKRTLETVGKCFKVEASYRNGVLYSDYCSFEIEDPKGVGRSNNIVMFRCNNTKDAIRRTDIILVEPETDNKKVDRSSQDSISDIGRSNNCSPRNIPEIPEEGAPPPYSAIYGGADRNDAGALPRNAPFENEDPTVRNRDIQPALASPTEKPKRANDSGRLKICPPSDIPENVQPGEAAPLSYSEIVKRGKYPNSAGALPKRAPYKNQNPPVREKEQNNYEPAVPAPLQENFLEANYFMCGKGEKKNQYPARARTSA
ncbi:unnamed protein product [Caenorhabditis auriculariae]|uniref:Uncharacterized protein n=1 Tax=Caenorhabditis auriculariae TaxID=2777116 RepID=A0A8S1HW22_9PELO|nr:unnamed protein product [Caenorhabditis auriculariae]